MTLSRVLVPLADGVGQGVLLFMVASGLTLVYGVMRILNFSHGGFFMLGAYVTYTLAQGRVQPALLLVGIVICAGMVVSAAGAVSEVSLFRRLYALPEVSSLLGTFALLLVTEGVGRLVWGIQPRSQPQSSAFLQQVGVADVQVPSYDLFLLGVGITTVISLEVLVYRTEFGRRVRATAADRSMAAILGIDVKAVFLVMFCLGIFLAGLGGGLVAPLIGLTPDIAVVFIIEAFAVVIVGGIGSIRGSFVAAIALGLANSFLVAFRPEFAEFSLYLAMAVILLIRPQGLFGRAEAAI